MQVLSFGEILFDLIEGEAYLGGAPLNFAAHLAQCGADSYIISRLGKDELGKQAEDQIRTLGLNSSLIQWDEKRPTGTVEVSLENGQPTYIIHKEVAWDYIESAEADHQIDKKGFDAFYFGSLSQRNKESRESLRKLVSQHTFKQVFFDVNLRQDFYSKELLQSSLSFCTILKLNDEEVSVLSGMLYRKAFEMEAFAREVSGDFDIRLLIITAGAKGCYVFEEDKLSFVNGFPAQVKDTVGAGDAFSAAFLYQYFHTRNALKSAEMANRLGAFVASSRGPIPTYTKEIQEMMRVD